MPSPRALSPTLAGIRADESRSTVAVVIANHELWDAITTFMTGYPLAVAAPLKDTTLLAKLHQAESATSHVAYHFVGVLTHRGVLPHLAIAANDAALLHTLFRLAKRQQYKHDPRLNFRKSMRCAVLLNRLEMLQSLEALKCSDDPNNWTWRAAEPHLMRIALRRSDADTRILDWLFARLPPGGSNSLFTWKDIAYHARAGNLAIVTWLREHGCEIKQKAIDDAARNNQLQVLEYLFQHSQCRCCKAVSDAAGMGYADVVQFLIQNQEKLVGKWHAISMASGSGHLPVVKLLVEHGVPPAYAEGMIHDPAQNGHLDVVRYLHEHVPGSGSKSAMTVAAIYGHLDIVRFLHENRTEGCSEDTLSLAAQNLHLDVVKFLREHYPQLQCCSSALDRVAAKGNLELLALLYTCSGNTECTATALTAAAKNGHSDVVAFLLQHQAEGSVSEALTLAALRGHLEVVKLLHAQLSPSESTFAALEAAARRHHHTIVQFLWEDPTRESSDFLKQAVDAGNIAIVRVFLRCASLEQLDEGREYALQQNRTKIAALLMRVLDDRRTQPSS